METHPLVGFFTQHSYVPQENLSLEWIFTFIYDRVELQIPTQ